MRLYIEGPDGALFDWNDQNPSIRPPENERERQMILATLAGALNCFGSSRTVGNDDEKEPICEIGFGLPRKVKKPGLRLVTGTGSDE